MSMAKRTKGISITLPIDLIEKMSIFISSKKGLQTSKLIRNILEDFLNSSSAKKDARFPNIKDTDFLISMEQYSNIMGIGRTALTSKVKKGDLEIIDVFDTDFVKLKQDDIRNIFFQIDEIKKQLSLLKEIVYNDVDRRGLLEDKIEALEKKIKN